MKFISEIFNWTTESWNSIRIVFRMQSFVRLSALRRAQRRGRTSDNVRSPAADREFFLYFIVISLDVIGPTRWVGPLASTLLAIHSVYLRRSRYNRLPRASLTCALSSLIIIMNRTRSFGTRLICECESCAYTFYSFSQMGPVRRPSSFEREMIIKKYSFRPPRVRRQ